MSYLALARKWRPRTFSQLVGQDHINKALMNALNQQRLHHAYLFTGTRGVGKTSIARILAKALNCEQGISATPCLQCDACTAIEQGRFIDLIEIDGASKTRVEDTRELLENVQYSPTNGRFKIYLIDEVHMLSTHSFNALLKTLEEPPAHVKFILATTDPQKLPITVLSRCLQFHLRHLPADLISQQLQFILNEEQLAFEPNALNILAKAANGSMRDALSLMDQAITGCDTKVSEHEVKTLLGYTHQDYALQLLTSLAAQDPSNILKISQQISCEGGHFQYVLDELLSHIHSITLFQHLGDANPLITPSNEIKTLSHSISAEDAQLFYQMVLNGKEEIHLAPTLAMGFSMILFRMLTFRPASQVTLPKMAYQTSTPIPAQTEARIESTKVSPDTTPAITEVISTNNTTTIAPPEPQKAPVPIIENEQDGEWAQIIPHLKLTGLSLNAVEHSEFISKSENLVLLKVARGHLSLFTPTVISRIESTLGDYYQSKIKLELQSDQSVQATPAKQKERLAQEKLQQAEQSLQSDPVFQHIQQEFSADLVKNSIVPLKDDL